MNYIMWWSISQSKVVKSLLLLRYQYAPYADEMYLRNHPNVGKTPEIHGDFKDGFPYWPSWSNSIKEIRSFSGRKNLYPEIHMSFINNLCLLAKTPYFKRKDFLCHLQGTGPPGPYEKVDQPMKP